MSRIKKLASETAVYGISSILARAINVMMVPFYANLFPTADNGIIGVVYAAFVFLNIIFTFGMESAYMKYASGDGRKAINTVFSTTTLLLMAVSIGLSLLIWVFEIPFAHLIGLNSPEWYYLIGYMLSILVLDTLGVIPQAELRLSNRPMRFAMIRLVNVVVNLGLFLVLVKGYGWGIEAVFFANLAASAVSLVQFLPLYFKHFRPQFNSGLAKALLLFGLPFLPSGLGYAITETVNRMFLNAMSQERVLALYGALIPATELATLHTPADYGDYVTGIFNNIYKIGVFMMLFTQMFRFAWQPFFLQHAKDDDAKTLFAQVFTFFTAIGLLIWLLVSFFALEIVSFPLPGGRHLIPQNYWFALSIVPIVLGAYFFQGWDYNFSAGLYITKNTKYFLQATLASALVTLVINYFLVPQYGVVMAALGTLAAYVTMSAVLYFRCQSVYPIPYEWRKVGLMMGIALLIFGLWYAFPVLQIWWIELLFVFSFLVALVGLNIIPKSTLQRLRRSKA